MRRNVEKGPINGNYLTELMDYFIRQWAPILPLWTALILEKMDGKTTETNIVAESLFSSIKNSYLPHKERQSIPAYINLMIDQYKR